MLELLERLFKLAGIIAGIAAFAAVYVQLRDINQRDRQKEIDDWSSSAVYKIIQQSSSPISIPELLPKYNAAANDFPTEIPRPILDERHLRIILLKLIQGLAISEVSNQSYSVRNDYAIMAAFNDANIILATQAQLAYQVLLSSKDPLTSDQLFQRIIALGGDKNYLTNNMSLVLQQLQIEGLVKYLEDGRVSVLDVRPIKINPDPTVAELAKKIDYQVFDYVITHGGADIYQNCYSPGTSPDISENSFMGRMRQLGLINIREVKKDAFKNKGDPNCFNTEVTQSYLNLRLYYMSTLFSMIR